MNSHDLAERTIAAWYLVLRYGHPKTSLLRPEHFRDPNIRSWWESACMRKESGWTPADLGIPSDAIVELSTISTPPARAVTDIERRIVADWGKRHLLVQLGRVMDDVKADRYETLEDALGSARVALGEAEAGCLTRSTTHREAGTRAVREWSEVLSGVRKSVPMPLRRLQERIGGWMRGKLWGIMAVSSGHKTTLARMSAWSAAKAGHSPLFWTMEDCATNVAGRTFAAEIREVDTAFFTAGVRPSGLTEFDMERIFGKLGAHLDSDSSARLRYIEETSPKLSRVCGVVSSEVARGCDFVVLDYMQLIRPDKGNEDTEHWKNVSQTMQDLAKDLDVPVLVTLQAKHEAQRAQRASGAPLVANDVFGGAAVVNNLWGMLILNQVRQAGGDGWVKDPSKIEIQTAKNKAGPTVGGEFGVMPSRDLITD